MSNSYKNVRLATLRAAVLGIGFDRVNTLDKIIGDNVDFHADSLDGTLMAMSVPVVERINELVATTTQPRTDSPPDPETVSAETKLPTPESIEPTPESIEPIAETIEPIASPAVDPLA